jgi:hypothetical protein
VKMGGSSPGNSVVLVEMDEEDPSGSQHSWSMPRKESDDQNQMEKISDSF